MSKKSVRPAAQPWQAAADGIELPPLAATQSAPIYYLFWRTDNVASTGDLIQKIHCGRGANQDTQHTNYKCYDGK